MATRNLSDNADKDVPNGAGYRFGIVVADWNSEVTHALLDGAVGTLTRHGVAEDDIVVRHVPGTFEVTLGAQWIAMYEDIDAVICLGCVIQGETPHFTYICQGVTQGITQLNLEYGIPFIFGILTTLTLEQALERAGGSHGNKGDEAAVTAIRMAELHLLMERP